MSTITDVLATALDATSFEAPPEWRCRTIVTFTEPDAHKKTSPATIVVISERLPEGETIHSLALQQLVDLRDRRGLRILDHRGFEVNDAPAVELTVERLGEDGPIIQTSTFVETQGKYGPVALNVTTTCAREEHEEMLPVFSALLEGTRARAASDVAPRPTGTEAAPGARGTGAAPRPTAIAIDAARPTQPAADPGEHAAFIPMPGVRRR